MRQWLLLAIWLASVGCASSGGVPSGAGLGTDSLSVVRQHAAAFSLGDLNALLEGVSPEIEWYTIDGDGVTLELKGREALRNAMMTYFAETPSFRSVIEGSVVSGAYVSVRERATWQGATGPRSQTAIGVFEVRDGAIRRVWYYPAQR